MFKITGNKGFHLTFKNGYTVSVQWGCGTYSDNRDRHEFPGIMDDSPGVPASSTAEIAGWYDESGLISFPGFHNDIVKGYQSADEVARFIYKVSRLKPPEIKTSTDET